jgi:hypothetical protein
MAVRRVAKQLPSEMLECEQLYSHTDARCHGEALYRMSAFHTFRYEVFLFFSQYACDVTAVPCCMNSAISTPFRPVPENSCHQLSGRQTSLNFFFGSFGECMCSHCFHCPLVSIFTFTRTMWLRNSSLSLWHRSKNVEAEAILCVLCGPESILN